jgi:hypothetical protein
LSMYLKIWWPLKLTATAILAETFSSLNYCRKAGMVRLRCCLQLLFVWTMSHMIEGKISGLVGTPWHLYSKLENFAKKTLAWSSNNHMGINVSKSKKISISLEESILLLQILSGILWWVSMGPIDRSLLLY